MSSVINEVAGLDADDFFLNQNYPNPFNPVTSLEFGISNSEFVSLKVYDVLGKEVRTLINEFKPAGHHKAVFDGKDLPGGIYFYRIIAGNFSQTRKMLLIK